MKIELPFSCFQIVQEKNSLLTFASLKMDLLISVTVEYERSLKLITVGHSVTEEKKIDNLSILYNYFNLFPFRSNDFFILNCKLNSSGMQCFFLS